MTPEAMRIAIAEACGWKQRKPVTTEYHKWARPGQSDFIWSDDFIPDYLSDLNAIHEAEKVLIEKGGMECASRYRFGEILFEMIGGSYGPDGENESSDSNFLLAHATAAQRAEAFLRTLNLWEA
jgi:hypothetical protein